MKMLKNKLQLGFFWRFIISTVCVFAILPSASPIAENQIIDQGIAAFKMDVELTTAEKAWLRDHQTIRIAGPRSFPPFHYFDKGGNLNGISADYINLIMNHLGVEVKIQKNLPWPEVLESARTGKIDLIPCIAKTVDREVFLDFSSPYLSFPLVIVSRNDASFIGGLDDLYGKKVAVIKKISTFDWLKSDKIDIVPYYVNSPLESLEAVSFGLADATIENLAAATYLIQKNGLTNIKIAAPTTYGNYDLYMAVRKDWPELLSIINKSLDAIPPKRHIEIRNKWLSIRYEYGISKTDVIKWISAVTLFFGSILMVILIWNRKLKRESFDRKLAETLARESEIKTSAALKEKETLLQEIHHRVKNNMQVISSLLDLQSSTIEDKQIKEVLRESQGRVHAMSVVHETLYDSDNLSEIDLQTYLSNVTTSVFQTYSVDPGKVILINEIEPMPISIKQASPLGLIINELISNSLKYAFPDDRNGQISVSMKKISDELVMIVSDDGIGMLKDLDWRNSNTLGLKLVRSLAEDQLDGSINMESKNGTKFTIKFNIEV
jgi:two-component sensor histidine kinase/ABC-type amino acid transport substrate-binding protein